MTDIQPDILDQGNTITEEASGCVNNPESARQQSPVDKKRSQQVSSQEQKVIENEPSVASPVQAQRIADQQLRSKRRISDLMSLPQRLQLVKARIYKHAVLESAGKLEGEDERDPCQDQERLSTAISKDFTTFENILNEDLIEFLCENQPISLQNFHKLGYEVDNSMNAVPLNDTAKDKITARNQCLARYGHYLFDEIAHAVNLAQLITSVLDNTKRQKVLDEERQQRCEDAALAALAEQKEDQEAEDCAKDMDEEDLEMCLAISDSEEQEQEEEIEKDKGEVEDEKKEDSSVEILAETPIIPASSTEKEIIITSGNLSTEKESPPKDDQQLKLKEGILHMESKSQDIQHIQPDEKNISEKQEESSNLDSLEGLIE